MYMLNNQHIYIFYNIQIYIKCINNYTYIIYYTIYYCSYSEMCHSTKLLL